MTAITKNFAIACVWFVCTTLSAYAQQEASGTPNAFAKTERAQPQAATTISCASATACQKTYVPLFATSGGAATVADSIMRQSGTTLNIAGNLNATGTVSAGALSSPFLSSSSIAATSTSNAVTGTMTSAANGIAAVTGAATATGASGFTFGVLGTSASDTGRAVVGLSSGTNAVGVIGENSTTGFGVVGKALGTAGTGVYGQGPSYAFQAVGNAQQDRSSGGWAKAMLFINTYQAPYTIQRCFNSTLPAPAATTPPCGFNLTELGPGVFNVDLGFEVDDRFVSATAFNDFAVPVIFPSGTQFQIFWYNVRTQQFAVGEYYWLTVY